MVSEKANYVTCSKGHKVYVIWSPMFKKYGFTCDECNTHSLQAVAPENNHIIKIKIIGKLASS